MMLVPEEPVIYKTYLNTLDDGFVGFISPVIINE
jgi:hypothetical protein